MGNVNVKNSTITNSSWDGIMYSGYGNGFDTGQIWSNTFHDNGASGFVGIACKNLSVKNNTSYANGATVGGASAGLRLWWPAASQPENNIFEYNTCYSNTVMLKLATMRNLIIVLLMPLVLRPIIILFTQTLLQEYGFSAE
jgi:hypothetical protein